MKMENNINAPKDGTIKTIRVQQGDAVMEGDHIVATVRGEGLRQGRNVFVVEIGAHSGYAIVNVGWDSAEVRIECREESNVIPVGVTAFGRVSVYPRDGAYQLYCTSLHADGIGDLYVAFEQLKEKLQAEGLFDAAHKRPLPRYPRRIAIVTSSAGAAVHDMIRILGHRWPMTKVVLLPVRVQGVEAPPEIVGAIKYANRHKVADLIITGRGGGSIEDLWAFNDERVVRAIYDSELPVISAVGHEPDVTIAAYVADVRASTPSNAAELAVPDINDIRDQLESLDIRQNQAVRKQLSGMRTKLDDIKSRRVLQNPMAYVDVKRAELDYVRDRIIAAADRVNAENRNKFSAMLDQLGIDQPRWEALTSFDEIDKFVDEVGFPVLIRPSYVLSGAAMNVCYDKEQMHVFLGAAAKVSKEYPVVVSQFMQNTKEIEFDAVAKNGEIYEYAISEHVEFAGVHSGDATLVFPAQNIYLATARRIKQISKKIAKELNISGPFNIQYLAKNNEVKVIECNLRASRSFPFVSKVVKRNFIETATKIMLGESVQKADSSDFDIDHIGVKASQFSFARLHRADPILSVDMSSTGEVGCIGTDFNDALLKSLYSVGFHKPEKGVLVSSGDVRGKVDLLDSCKLLQEKGLKIYATAGTQQFLADNGVKAEKVDWPDEQQNGGVNIADLMKEHSIDLVVNIPKNHTHRELTNGYKIRRSAIDHNIPLLTNARLASAFLHATCAKEMSDIQIKSWQEY